MHRVDQCRLILRQILGRMVAARGLQIGDDGLRQCPFVKRARSVLGHGAQRGGKTAKVAFRLAQGGPARGFGKAVFVQKRLGRCGEGGEVFGRTTKDQLRVPVHRQTIIGKLDRRGQQIGPRFRGKAFMRQTHASDLTGNGNRLGPKDIAVFQHRRPGEQIARLAAHDGIVRDIQPLGGFHSEFDDLGRLFARHAHDHKAAAAHTAHPGFSRAKRKGGGNRRIHRIAALRHDIRPDLRGNTALRGDDPLAAAGRGFSDLPRGILLLGHWGHPDV